MVDFTGKMHNGAKFFCHMKDIGRNDKRRWYSSRFTLRVRRKPPITFYSRVDSDLAAVSSNGQHYRMQQDLARLESKGIDTSTITYHT